MKILKAGPLRVRAVGDAAPGATRAAPAIVLCHGFGAPGDDLVSLAHAIDAGEGVRFFFPEAPLSADPGFGNGRAWWPIDMFALQLELARGARQWDREATPAGMVEAREALVGCLRALVAEGEIDPARTILGGFSQGAMIATDVALDGDVLALEMAGLAILSGAWLRAEDWARSLARRALPDARRPLHVFQSHGRADPLLPFAIAESFHEALVRGGARATFAPFRGGHEIPQAVGNGLSAFAREMLAPR